MGKFFTWIGDLVKSCFDGIIGFFVSLWNLFWSILAGIGQYFVDAWRYLWDWVAWAFYCGIDWLLSQFVAVLDLLAENFQLEFDFTPFETIFQTVSAVNVFIPLDTFLLCGGIYFACLIGWVIYKFVKSWLPLVSGS